MVLRCVVDRVSNQPLHRFKLVDVIGGYLLEIFLVDELEDGVGENRARLVFVMMTIDRHHENIPHIFHTLRQVVN